MKNYLLLFTLLLLSLTSFGQIDNDYVRIEVFPEDIRPCDTSFVKVTVLFKTPKLSNLKIQLDLPTGVYYAGGLIIEGAPNYSGSVDYSDLNKPIIGVTNVKPGSGGESKLGDLVTFYFNKVATCEVLQALKNGEIFKDIQIVGLREDGVKKDFLNNDKTTSTYQLLVPSLGLQSIPNKDAYVGQVVSRNITVVESGIGRLDWFVHKVTIGSDIGNYQLSYNGTNLTPDSISGQEYFYYLHMDKAPFMGTIGNGDQYFENGETIVLKESFQVQGCAGSEITHRDYWGCSLSTLCEGSKPETGYLTFNASAPGIVMTKVAGDDYMDICGGQSWTIKFENTATHQGATAIDFNINFGLGHNTSDESLFGFNPFWAFDAYGVRVVGGFELKGDAASVSQPVTLSSWPSSLYPTSGSGSSMWLPFDYFTTDPDGPGGLEDIDGDGYYDDLAPGASFEFKFDYEWNLNTPSCGKGRVDYSRWEHLYIDAIFKNQCGLKQYSKRMDFEYSNIIRDYLQESTFIYPDAVVDGKDFDFSIKPWFYRGGGWSQELGYPRCNGENMFTGSGVTWKVIITVPDGVSLQPSAPASFSQVGNEITYTTPKYEFKFYDFPLHYDCAAYTGGEKFTINYKTNYSCTCWSQDIHCGSVEIQSGCPVACNGPNTLEFKPLRSNAGWTDYTHSTKVVLDENIHSLDTYMARDTMNVFAEAVIRDSMVENLFFQMEYTTPSGGGDENLFGFVDGKIEIKDISAGVFSGALSSPPTRTVVGPNHYKVIFDLSNYKNLVSSTYKYGEGDENDTILVNINLILSGSFGDVNFHKLKDFKGTFFAKDLSGNESKCNSIYRKAKYLKVRRSTSGYAPDYSEFCDASYFWAPLWNYSTAGHSFPGEYRNPIEWDSTIIDIPVGARYAGYTTYTASGSAQNTTNGKIIATVVGDKLVVKRGPDFRQQDQQGTNYPRVQPQFVGTCESDHNTNADFTIYYKDYAYVDPEPKVLSNKGVFEYLAPIFELTSPHQIVTVVTDEPYFDVQLCVSTKDPVDFNWLKVEKVPGFSVSKAFILDASGIEMPTNFTVINGNTYIEAGQVNSGPTGCKTIRFYGNVASCTPSSLHVSHGWDCLAYPADFEMVDKCYRLDLEFFINPEEAQLQLEVASLPDSIKYCESFLMKLEMNSAQVANLLEPIVTLDIAADISYMSVDSIVVEYPKGSGNKEQVSITMNGGQMVLNIFDHNAIFDSGMAGSHEQADANDRIAVIDCYFNLQCGFVDLSTVELGASGLSPCGSPAISSGVNLTTDDLPIIGKTNDYFVYHDVTILDTIKNCSTTMTVDIQSTIIAGETSDADTILVTVPNGLNYVVGSFNCSSANCPTFVNLATVNGQDQVALSIPVGLVNLDSMEYQFDVISNNSYCGLDSFMIESFVVSKIGSCGLIPCDPAKKKTGGKSALIEIAKPDLAFLPETVASSNATSSGAIKYGVSLNIENVGIDATSGYDYTIYCADGSGNASTQIYSGSFNDIILAGGKFVKYIYFDASTACDPVNGLYIEILPSNANCLCEAISYHITLTPGMDAVDDNYTINEDTQLDADVRDNDTPIAGAFNDTALKLTDVSNGTLVFGPKGVFNYKPNLNFNGVDVFTYSTCDDGIPALCDSAKVTITVLPIPDAPLAEDDHYTTNEDTKLTGENVLDNDIEPDAGGVLVVTTTPLLDVVNGTLALNANGTFEYTPSLNYYGQDSFKYVVCNTATQVKCDTATVYIEVLPINDMPIAQDDNYTTDEDVTLSVIDTLLGVLKNDSDADGDVLTVSTAPIINVSNGTLTLNTDGTFEYVPNAGFFGSDSFTYEVCDNGTPKLCTTAIVNITVNEVFEITMDCAALTDIELTLVPGNLTEVATWTAPTATTTCPTGGLTITQITGLSSGSGFAEGTHLIEYEATDNCSVSEKCSFNIIINPAETGVITMDCGPLVDINYQLQPGQTEKMLTWSAPTASTTCSLDGVVVTQTEGSPSGTSFTEGTYHVAYEASDACLDEVKKCEFDITIAPAEKGVITMDCTPVPDVDYQLLPGETSHVINWSSPSATTSCTLGGLTVTQVNGLPSGSAFTEGVHLINYEATDACLDAIKDCEFEITISPAETGEISMTCDPALDIEVTLSPGETTHMITWTAPTAMTSCSLGGLTVTQVSGLPSGSAFVEGTYTITYEAKDACLDEEKQCSFSIKVNPAPTGEVNMDCSSLVDIELTLVPGTTTQVATWTDPVATTSCSLGGLIVTQTTGPTSGSDFAEGVYTIEYETSDACLDAVKKCAFTVTILPAPTGEVTIDCSTMQDVDITLSPGDVGEVVNWTAPVATTTCSLGGVVITQTQGQPSGTAFAAGEYLIEYEATDACLDAVKKCSFTIIIRNVVVIANPKTIDCNTPVVTLDGSGSSQNSTFVYAWTTTTGNIVGGQNTSVAQVDKPGDYTLSISDPATSFKASATVTVNIDTISPTAVINEIDKLTCSNTSLFLNATGSDVGDYTYSWTTTNGHIVGATNALLAEVNQVGEYEFEIINNNTGCSTKLVKTVEEDKEKPLALVQEPNEVITCSNQCLDLNGSGSATGAEYAYQWSTTDGIIQAGADALQATVCAKGVYELRVLNTKNGCSSTNLVQVKANVEAPSVNAVSNQPLTCTVKEVYIEANATSGSGNYSYEWSPSSGVVSGQNTSNPIVNQSGFFTVIVTDEGNGCTTTSNVVVDAATDMPQLSLAAKDTLTCRDSIVELSATYNSTFDISWSTNDGVIKSGLTSANPMVAKEGNYTAIVTAPLTGCSTKKTVSVAANRVTPNVTVDDIRKLDCTSNAVQIGGLDNASMDKVLFHWTTLDGHFVSSANLPNPIVDELGTYYLEATSTTNGCSSGGEVTVSELEAVNGAEIETALPRCDGGAGAIIVKEVLGASGPFTYSFDGGNNFGTSPIQVGLYPGDYEVVIQDAMGCEYRETTNLPIPKEGDILIEPNVMITMGDSTHLEAFTSTALNAIDTIIWTPNDELTCLGCFEQTVKPMITTIYSVTIIDTLGCVATAKTTVHVADPDIFIPNAFSPNDGDGQNDYFTVMGNTTRVEEIVTMQVYDRWGSLIFSKEHMPLNDYNEGWDGKFRGKSVQRGVYVYAITVRYIDGKEVQFVGDVTVAN